MGDPIDPDRSAPDRSAPLEPGDPGSDIRHGGGVDYERAVASPRFRELRGRHRRFVFPLAVAFIVWYLAYVLLAAFAHDFMATPVIGRINVGLLLGLAQFVTTFGITMWYVSFANRTLDPLAAQMREDLAAEDAR
ncbi:Inner membrane protein YjcH [Pseudoclavibacter triregionum]|nr:Inner membrane protein YjcH [Pseudoclavibacter triregionum]